MILSTIFSKFSTSAIDSDFANSRRIFLREFFYNCNHGGSDFAMDLLPLFVETAFFAAAKDNGAAKCGKIFGKE